MDCINFTEIKSFAKLKSLAEHPHDLTSADGLTASRIAEFKVSSCGFDYLFATQRVTRQVLDALQEMADEAGLVDTFLSMKNGAVLNRIEGIVSENRQVLHTACRDIFAAHPHEPLLTGKAKAELAKLRRFLDDLDAGRLTNAQGQGFTTMVQVGIGGSDLGPRAMYLALQAYRQPGRSARFIANVDPDDTAEVLKGIELSRTLFNVVSKSGTTLETLTNERQVWEALQQAGLDPARHLVAVTGEGSPLDDPKRYLASFYMDDAIGGRYSGTSMVGLVTLGFALGWAAVEEILRGANAIDQAAEQRGIMHNIPLLMALLGIWNRNFLGYSTLAILPYSQALARFPAHLQQCDMESNGKSVSRRGKPVTWGTGPVVWGEPGTNGQHAFYQLLHQGTDIIPAEFIGFRQNQYGLDVVIDGTNSQQKLAANMLAQALALALGKQDINPNKAFAGNRPSAVLLADRLTPETMGALLALFEHRIAFQGFCWNINSFDQEGVQLGKVLAKDLLKRMAWQGTDQRGENHPKSIGEVLLQQAGFL